MTTTIMPTTAAIICLEGGWVVAIDNDAHRTPPTPSSFSSSSWGRLMGGMGGMSTISSLSVMQRLFESGVIHFVATSNP